LVPAAARGSRFFSGRGLAITLSPPTSGPPPVRSGRRDGIFPVRTTPRAFARRRDSSGMVSLQDPAGRDMPDARRPGRLFASPGEPDGRQSLVYALKDQSV
jgi:hypothetical protein